MTSNRLGRALAATTAAAALAVALPLAAFAAPHSGSGSGQASGRIANQQQRIQRGYQNGQLTKKEYNKDEARLNAIAKQKAQEKAANGGHLTEAQRDKLHNELSRSGHDIYFTKHNTVHQPGAPDRGKVALQKLPSRNSPGYYSDRAQRQMDRLHNGVVSGSLTQHEYRVAVTRLNKIDAQRERWMKAQNGTLTDAQKAQLNAEFDQESSLIHVGRHNAQDQPGR
jgi:hypothetical protein